MKIDFKQLREERGYTQKHVAEQANLTIASISRLENGITEPSLETATKYLKALGLELKVVETL